MKKETLLFILLIITCISTSFAQKKEDLFNAINIAGNQRMLGQKMAKNKLFIEVNRKRIEAEKEVEKTIEEFEEGLEVLEKIAPDNTVKYKVNIQKFAFRSYKTLILDTTKKSMREVITWNTLFLKICDDVVRSLSNYTKTNDIGLNKNEEYTLKLIAEATEESGQLRYLTQRLSLYYALDFYDRHKVNDQEIYQLVNTIDKNIGHLTTLEFNTVDIDDDLSTLLYEWNILKKELYENGDKNKKLKKMSPEKLYDSSNNILDKATHLTNLYTKL